MGLRRFPFSTAVRIAVAFMLCGAVRVDACTVCFGDPDSPLTHGAKWGIVTMVLLTYSLLVGMASMLGFIMFRARRRHLSAVREENDG